MQSAEIGSTAHTLLQGLSTSVMGGRADVVGQDKDRRAEGKRRRQPTSVSPPIEAATAAAVGERLTGAQWA